MNLSPFAQSEEHRDDGVPEEYLLIIVRSSHLVLSVDHLHVGVSAHGGTLSCTSSAPAQLMSATWNPA